jgi:hypothetical protein
MNFLLELFVFEKFKLKSNGKVKSVYFMLWRKYQFKACQYINSVLVFSFSMSHSDNIVKNKIHLQNNERYRNLVMYFKDFYNCSEIQTVLYF